MQIFLIILGLLILVLTFWDFFHTTISGNGFGFISSKINEILAAIILRPKSKTLFHYSGYIHVIANVFLLFVFIIAGTFIIFISADSMVVNVETEMPASTLERFFYTCYLLSTAGFGDFVPGNSLSNILSSIFSFVGLIFWTTAVAYVISLINSVLKKKELALYIFSLGENMDELHNYFTIDQNLTTLTGKSGYLRQMINTNTSNYTTFPIIRYFLTRKKRSSLVLQMAALYEVLNALEKKVKSDSIQDIKIKSILKSIEYFLKTEKQTPLNYTYEKKELKDLRSFWQKHGKMNNLNTSMDETMSNALYKAGWDWKDVYESKK